jgi:nucleoside-diphosphate-sugar epimerase
MANIALFGAAGAIGSSVANALRAQGRAYRVVGRNRTSLQSAFGADALAEIVTWNPDDAASVRAAAKGIDTIIYLVGVPYDQFQLHPIVMRQTLEGAIAEGVKRMLLIGTVYPYGMPRTTPIKESHPRDPHTFKGRMRKEQEDLLLTAHADGKIQGGVLRLPDFYGPGVEKSYLDSLFKAAGEGGTANMLGPIDTPHEFVFVPDVGPVVTAMMEHPGAYGRWWHFAGPGAITQREALDRVFRMAGREPRFRVAGKTTLRLLGLFKPMMRELAEMNYLLTNPVLMEDSALQDLIGPLSKTSYDEGFRRSLEAVTKGLASRRNKELQAVC